MVLLSWIGQSAVEELKLKNFNAKCDARGVVTVGIDVTDRKFNILTTEVFAELQTLLANLEQDTTARLVVFRGAKETGFLAGADLKEINAMPDRESLQRFGVAGQEAFDRLERLKIPTIAVVHGPCLGGGLEFALACRYRIARDDAATSFGVPEVRLGLLPAWGGVQRLTERVGLESSLRMLWTGSKISPRRAMELGVVDAIWPPDEFDAGVEQFIAEQLTRGADSQTAETLLPPSGPRHLNEADATILNAAWRRLDRGQHGPSLKAILEAVEAGYREGRNSGITKARDAFAELRFSEFGRRRLARFFNRSRASRKPATSST
jgi:3-hydroxyacyl-CoA dehydrogenase/enoyl-CoA hydratase/3-hydroxybutyryl-CoA epimerase